MKIIVSSKNFQKLILLAVDNETKTVEIDGPKECIVFKGKEELEFSAHPTVFSKESDVCFSFDNKRFMKLHSVLRTLEEQPVVLEFRDYEENLPFTLSEFVMSF